MIAPDHIDEYPLDRVDPRARLTVMTNIMGRESGFTTGEALRQHWDSPELQRVSPNFVCPPLLNPHDRVICPDGNVLFIRFTSEKFQLLSDSINQLDNESNMLKKKHNPPPKKVAAVKRSATGKVTAKKVKPKKEGNYKWLLQRLKAQALDALSVDTNRATIRAGLKDLEKFTDVRVFLERAGVQAGTFEKFLDEFFDASINR